MLCHEFKDWGIHGSQVSVNFKYLTCPLYKNEILFSEVDKLGVTCSFCDLRVESNFAHSILEIQCFQIGVSYGLWSHKISIKVSHQISWHKKCILICI